MERKIYEEYVKILKEELIPAMGCTEPIAVAYGAALAAEALGTLPEKMEVGVSANIIKNVKSVVVPCTGGLRGIEAAVCAGIVSGRPDKELELLTEITQEQKALIKKMTEQMSIHVRETDSGCIFDIQITARAGEHSGFVRIAGSHTNVVLLKHDEKILLEKEFEVQTEECETDRSLLNVEQIVEFADCVELSDVEEVLERQIAMNTAIAEEGIIGGWGAGIGRIMLDAYGNNVHTRAKAMAAAGSDARMSGCELPVVINSGSGNQGMTASLPVIVYATEEEASKEMLLRSLVVSNLVTIHLKTGIGRLSAYCGAVSAGCGAGAGICYLHGGKSYEISHTIVNAAAIDSGIICDGAKPSCAAKIASAVEAGLLAVEMQKKGSQFYAGEGIVKKGVENTIRNVGELAKEGMRETDKTIIRMMIR